MLTSGYLGRQTQRERDAANQQLAAIDNQLGVGPWGQSMAPLMQENRDNYQLMANDPQAMHRKALEAAWAAGDGRPNPFPGSSFPGSSTSISAPGRPAGSMSLSRSLIDRRRKLPAAYADSSRFSNPNPSRFPNPFN